MSWKPIVVGVDDSLEAARAATLAYQIAKAAGTSCRLVTAVPDPWSAAAAAEVPLDIAVLSEELEELTRQTIQDVLTEEGPAELASGVETRMGRPQKVLEDFARECGAGLVVLGGKHHAALARWLGGSTAHHVVRKLDIPVLVAGPGSLAIKTVLAAVDVSFAAGPTLEMAQQFVELFDGRLVTLHVVEPLPIAAEVPIPFDTEDVVARSRERLERDVWPNIRVPNAEKGVRIGSIPDSVTAAVKEWGADLVVVGSHGKGWVDRLLLGSTTERLLNSLPASLLIVPVSPKS